MSTGVQQDIYHACVKFLLRHSAVREGPNVDAAKFSEGLFAIRRQEATLNVLVKELAEKASKTIMHPSPHISDLLDALLTFTWYQNWTKPQLDIVQLVIVLAQRSGDQRREADAILCYSNALYALNRYDNASMEYQRANQQYLISGDPMTALYLSLEPLRCMAWRGAKIEHVIPMLDKFPIMSLHCPPSVLAEDENVRVQARNFLSRGDLYCANQNPAEAYECYSKAISFLVECRQDAAYCQSRMGQALGMMGKFDEALTQLDQAIATQEELGLNGDLINSQLVKIRCLKAMDRWGGELPELVNATLKKANAFGAPLAIAKAQEELAEMYFRRKDWLSAHLSYIGAIKECEKMDNILAKSVARNCRHNLELVKEKADIPECVVDFWKPDW